MTTVRISLARFETDRYETVKRLLEDSRQTLEPAIKALEGNISYYVGIDQTNNTMTNVSIWQTAEQAKQMASMKEMADLAGVFIEAGVRFERPITNHHVLWEL